MKNPEIPMTEIDKIIENISKKNELLRDYCLENKNELTKLLNYLIPPVDLECLSSAFEIFRQADIPLLENEEFCISVIENLLLGNPLSCLFESLVRADITFSENKSFYKVALKNSRYGKILSEALEALITADLPFIGNEKHFLTVLERQDYAKLLPRGLEALAKAKVNFNEHPEFFLEVMETTHYIELITPIFESLIQVGIHFPEYKAIYWGIAKNYTYAQKLSQKISMLELNDILNERDKADYITAAQEAFYSDHRLAIFKELANAEVSFSNNETLYIEVIKNLDEGNESDDNAFEQILATFNEHDIKFEKYPQYFNNHLLVTHPSLTNDVFTSLFAAGFSLDPHKSWFDAIVALLSSPKVHRQTIVDIVNQSCKYVKDNANIDPNECQIIIDRVKKQYNSLTFGPLVKYDATYKIEEILEALVSDRIENITLDFTTSGYILTLPDTMPIYLSLLIKNANLSHLTLSDKLLGELFDLLNDIVKTPLEIANPDPEPTVALLHPAEQLSIFYFISAGQYRNINGFFRPEPLTDEYALSSDENHNSIAYFIM